MYDYCLFVHKSEEKISDLAVKLHRKLLETGKDTLVASYDQALVVLEFMHSQYSSVKSHDDGFKLSEDFARKDEMKGLFEEAFTMLDYEKHSPRDKDAFYDRCRFAYGKLRLIADGCRSPIKQKLSGIDQLMRRLHNDCASEGGNISRIISRDEKFVEQY